MGVECVAGDVAQAAESMAVTEPADHRALAVGYFNAAWSLIDRADRSADDDRDMLGLAFASRQHWIEAGGTEENLAVADWQVAHAASLAGFADVALAFAHAAVARVDVPIWMQASAHEGLARAHAAAGDRDGYAAAKARCEDLLALVDDDEDRDLVASQLASIPPPA